MSWLPRQQPVSPVSKRSGECCRSSMAFSRSSTKGSTASRDGVRESTAVFEGVCKAPLPSGERGERDVDPALQTPSESTGGDRDAQSTGQIDELLPGSVIKRDTCSGRTRSFALLRLTGQGDFAGAGCCRTVPHTLAKRLDLVEEMVGAGKLIHVEEYEEDGVGSTRIDVGMTTR